jgi:ubiquinone/menaquinone biosynthesis C-methylase UbiE
MTKTWQNLYEKTKPILDKHYPDYESAKDYAKQFLNNNLKQGDIVLDLGCGIHSEDFQAIKHKIKLIGVDFAKQSGQQNQLLDEFKQVDLNKKLPFTDNSFDLVYSRFVIEHLQDPDQTYQEVYRVLKPGGYFIILTPNLYNKLIFLSKILPISLHKFLRAKLTGVAEEEVFPTYYRSNRPAKIKKQLKNSGFKNIKIIKKGGMFEYFMANKLLFILMIYCEKLTDYIFKFSKLHLVIICQK